MSFMAQLNDDRSVELSPPPPILVDGWRHHGIDTEAASEVWAACEAVLWADRSSPRGRALAWFRELTLRLTVHQPERWTPHLPRLQRLLRFMSGDVFTLTLHPMSDQPAETTHDYGWLQELPADETVERTTLMSGGMDSLTGAILVADWPGQSLPVRFFARGGRHAKTIHAHLAEQHPKLLSLVVAPGATGPMDESSMRTRSLFFTVRAALLAAACGASIVIIPENGVMTYHLPLGPARDGSFSTRSTHPHVLREVSWLLATICGVTVSFVNPLRSFTRGELVTLLSERGYGDLIRESFTCQRPGAGMGKHCGMCVPCLHRRFALFASAPDLREPYAFDAFANFQNLPIEGRRNLADLVTFARRWELPATQEHALLHLASQHLTDTEIREAIAVYERFCGEILTVLHERFPLLSRHLRV